jgi:hypothetical protein
MDPNPTPDLDATFFCLVAKGTYGSGSKVPKKLPVRIQWIRTVTLFSSMFCLAFTFV